MAFYRRAAQVAAGRFAHAEAIRLYREALSVIKAMPQGRDRDSMELAVLTALAEGAFARRCRCSPTFPHGMAGPVPRERPWTPPSPPGASTTTCGGCPRSCGCARAPTSRGKRSRGCAAAAGLAASHGSVALVGRCEDDLRACGVPLASSAP